MKVNNIGKREIILFVIAGVLLLFGILCCCDAFNVFSIIVGIMCLGGGLTLAIIGAMPDRSLLDFKGIVAALIFGLGIACVWEQDIALIVFALIPFLLMGFGALLIADGILVVVFPFRKNTGLMIFEFVTGVVSLTLGILTLTVDWFGIHSDLILGLIICIFAVLVVLYALLVNPEAYKKYMTTEEDAKAYYANKSEAPAEEAAPAQVAAPAEESPAEATDSDEAPATEEATEDAPATEAAE